MVQGKGDLELEGEEQEAKGMGMVVVKDERNPRMGRRVVVGMGVDGELILEIEFFLGKLEVVEDSLGDGSFKSDSHGSLLIFHFL